MIPYIFIENADIKQQEMGIPKPQKIPSRIITRDRAIAFMNSGSSPMLHHEDLILNYPR
jgi:hypothetical protein